MNPEKLHTRGTNRSVLGMTSRNLISMPARPSICTVLLCVAAATTIADDGAGEEKGLTLRIRQGEAQAEQPRRTPDAPSTALHPDDVTRLLGRLPAASTTPGVRKPFALRKGSLPPARTGKTREEVFPPPKDLQKPEDPAAKTLEVLRFAPEGEVPIASHLSITFSQPMVELDTVRSLAAGSIPVKLEPRPQGAWRWVGTKTLLFEPRPFATKDGETPKGRFPMATSYTVAVAAGPPTTVGGRLEKGVRWSFATPAPRVVRSHPPSNAPQPLQPVVVLGFDQRIDAKTMLESVVLRAGGQRHGVHLASDAEIGADADARRLLAELEKDRVVALRPDGPLPSGTPIDVVVEKGAPSLEGGRVTSEGQSHRFQTHARFKIVSHQCGWGREKKACPPGNPFRINFNNPIDAEAFDPSMIEIEPALPGFQANIYNRQLQIHGATKGRTTYTVTLPASLPDRFGQTLEAEAVLTFEVGAAPAAIHAPVDMITVLDPGGPPRFSVFTTNHEKIEVSAYRVEPSDWHAYLAYQRDHRRRNTKATLPGRKVHEASIDVETKPDELVETAIDLTSAIEEGGRHIVLVVEPTTQPDPKRPQRVVSWVQKTRIGLDVFVGGDRLVVWANSLVDGRPLEGVDLKILSLRLAGESGKDGIATFGLTKRQPGRPAIVLATHGDDTAILPESTSWWSRQSSWWNQQQHDSLRWYVIDDRGMYRPGERVHVKGWVRRWSRGPQGDVEAIDRQVAKIKYLVRDPRRNELARGIVQITPLGGFELSFAIPDDANLGHGHIELTAEAAGGLDGLTSHHQIQIQEFRRPEFEVAAKASAGPHLVKGHAEVSVSARYYTGGALAGAQTAWRVTPSPGEYRPPGWDKFSFGKWTPWWRHHGWDRSGHGAGTHVSTFSGKTDATGVHRIRVDFDAVDPPRAMSVSAQASISDVNRQTWSSTATLLVHPSLLYVGLRSDRTFVEKGKPLEIEAIATDIDGKTVAETLIDLRCYRVRWVQEKGTWSEREELAGERRLAAADEPVSASFDGLEGGTYRVRAAVVDGLDRRNESELTLWVAGEKRPKRRGVDKEQVTLIPDRKDYRPGDVAKILVQMPFSPAEAVVTLRRTGLVETRRVRIEQSSYTLEVPVVDAHIPNLHVQVDLVGATARVDDDGNVDAKLPKRPAYASGQVQLLVPPLSRTLQVRARPRHAEVEPGAETFVDVLVKDAGGKPLAGAEVAVIVVDEAVLALTSYDLSDPVGLFYHTRPPGVRDHHSRRFVRLRAFEQRFAGAKTQRGQTWGVAEDGEAASFAFDNRDKLLVSGFNAFGAGRAPMAAAKMGRRLDGGGGAQAAPIDLRKSFDALALFAAALPTDLDGYARVKVKVPDSLTRYRVMTVAAAGGKLFGKSESTITTRLGLMVRPSAPRFLNFGDRFELPVVLQNQTDEPMAVDVALRASNAKLTHGAGRRVTVPANDRVEVRFPSATAQAGVARFQVAAASGKHADAADVEVPVWTPATTEAFATYGVIASATSAGGSKQQTIVQPVARPEGVIADFGGLEITTSSTALQALTDAFIYISEYPYGCAEQIASRVLTTAALRDVLAAFEADGLPPPQALVAAVSRDVKKLHGMQHGDGGFGFWRRDSRAWPYLGVHVAHAITRASQKDFSIPDQMLQHSAKYLATIDSHIPKEYPERARRSIQSYALYVRSLGATKDDERRAVAGLARGLVREATIEKLPLEATGWLLAAMGKDPASAAERRAVLANISRRVTETAATAQFTTSYADTSQHLLLHSTRRTDAILLDALIGEDPDSDVIPKIVRGLLGHRKQGRWSNTQENAFVLVALDRYFRVYEKEDPYFVAKAWLGDRFAGEHGFEGRSTDRHHISIPMSYLTEAKASQNLVLSKEGRGRLYYRLGLRYAPSSLKLDPSDQGFAVQRSYEGVDDPNDVRRGKDGVWRVKLGTRVRVHLEMVAPARRYHVALVDPLPAGLEAMNPSLAVTGNVPAAGARGKSSRKPRLDWWWSRTWYEHQNLRDERAEAFSSLLRAGVHEYSYVTRATTPGSFVVPPTKAEEMYHPEIFGRSASDRVVVE